MQCTYRSVRRVISNIQQHHEPNNRRILRLPSQCIEKRKQFTIHKGNSSIQRYGFIANDRTTDQSFKSDIGDAPTIQQHHETKT